MKLERLAGTTSDIWQIFIADKTSTVGAGLAGLVFNTATITAYYHRDTDTTATVINLVTMTVGTFTSSGFKEIDAANMPGWYQFCPPNAALASGAKSCAFHLKGGGNMVDLPIEVQLVAYNPDAALATPTNITAGTITTVTNQLTAAAIATGVWQDATVGDFTTASSIGKALFTGNFVPGAAGGLLIAGSNAGTTTFGALTVTGTFTISDGLVVTRSSSNVDGISVTGNGTGNGIKTTSGSGATGDGFRSTSSATSGHGIVSLGAGNGNGLLANGAGTGSGFSITGGATGNGIFVHGGGTSGDGIKVVTTSGHGVEIAPLGTNMHGIISTGGDGGTSDGMKLVAGTGGVDLRANITGNITGTLSTVTTLTNLPSITANWLTAAGINAGALNGKGDWLLASSYTAPLSAAATATAVWTDNVAGDFTIGATIGKSVMNGVGLGTGLTVANLTTLPSIPANWLTAAGINAGALNGKGDWLLAASYTAPLSAAATATAVWQDTTAGDFTLGASIGKSIMNGVALGTGLTVNDLTTKTGFSLTANGLNGVLMSDLGAPPAANASVVSGLSWLFMSVQNDRKTTSTQDTIANSAGAVVGTATVSDDSVTYEKTKYA